MSKKVVLLGDVCDVRDGTHDSPKYIDTGYPLITSKNISTGNINLDNVSYISELDYNKINERSFVDDGDILMPMIGTIGNPIIVKKTFDFAIKNVALIKFPYEKSVFNKYVAYVLNSNLFLNYIENKNRGGTQKFISLGDIRKFQFLLPPIEDQEKIAEILDRASNLISLRKKQIEKLDLLVRAKYIDMFSDPISNSLDWELKPLGDICNMRAGKGIKAVDIYEHNHDDLYPCYGGNGLRGYVKDYSHEGELTLIGRQGALCGNVQYAQGKFYATEHAIVTQPKIRMNTYWLYFMLKEMNLNRLSTGAAQPGLNVSTLVPLNVIFPPLDLQNHFALFAQKVKCEKSIFQQGLVKLELNYNALMQQYFG